MNIFGELRHDVAFFNATGIGVLHSGRIGVIDGEPCPERNSVGVIAIGNEGGVVRLRVPRESITILGGFNPTEGAGDRLYVGEYSGGDHRVTVFDIDAQGNTCGEPRQLTIAHRHSVSIGWGYIGDGPADLALALIRDAFREDYTLDGIGIAETCYMEFSREFVQRQPERSRWSTTASDLRRRIVAMRQEAA